MREEKLRQAIVVYANQYLGWGKANGRNRIIIDKYNNLCSTGMYKLSYTDPWCAAFVSVVKHDAKLDAIIPTECSCEKMIKYFMKKNLWIEDGEYIPKQGDLIFYNWNISKQPNNGESHHIGIVIACDGKTISVVEGNYSNQVKERKISKGNGFIRGYALPEYKSISKEDNEPNEKYLVGHVYRIGVNDLNIRTGPGIKYLKKSRSELTDNAKEYSNMLGQLKKGTPITCLELYQDGLDLWMRIPSGWVAVIYQNNNYIY